MGENYLFFCFTYLCFSYSFFLFRTFWICVGKFDENFIPLATNESATVQKAKSIYPWEGIYEVNLTEDFFSFPSFPRYSWNIYYGALGSFNEIWWISLVIQKKIDAQILWSISNNHRQTFSIDLLTFLYFSPSNEKKTFTQLYWGKWLEKSQLIEHKLT